MKVFLAIVASLLVIALAFELYSLWGRSRAAKGEFQAAQKKLQDVSIDQEKLQAELNYLANPLNLEKEVRSRFNLKKPGEKSVIIVPKTTTTAPASNPF